MTSSNEAMGALVGVNGALFDVFFVEMSLKAISLSTINRHEF